MGDEVIVARLQHRVAGDHRSALDELRVRRDQAGSILNKAKGLRCTAPDGAFYLFANCAGTLGRRAPDGRIIENDFMFANYLLDSAGVGTVHGSGFRRATIHPCRLCGRP